MNKSELFVGMKLKHKNLGVVSFDVSAWYLEKKNPDSTSVFVIHDGEMKEVSLALLSHE